MRTDPAHPFFAPLLRVAALLSLAAGIESCQSDEITYVMTQPYRTKTYTVAVVLPDGETGNYRPTVEWALENLLSAQKALIGEDDSVVVKLNLEWHDENKEDMESLSSQLAWRQDVLAIVGPLDNANVDKMATACLATSKALIVPGATSEQLVRKYVVYGKGNRDYSVTSPFLWSLAETDVTQCQALLSKVQDRSLRTVALLTPDDVYGRTFEEWIPFEASDMGLQLVEQRIYADTAQLRQEASLVMKSGADCVIAAVHDASEARLLLDVKTQAGEGAPRVMLADRAYTEEFRNMAPQMPDTGVEGVALYADPATGFEESYRQHFSIELMDLNAQVYDAVALAGFTAYEKYRTGDRMDSNRDTNEIIRRMTSDGSSPHVVWTELGMRSFFTMLKNGVRAKMVGACGTLRFDSLAYTSLLESTYLHWMLYGDYVRPVDYYSRNGGSHTSPTLASWNWKVNGLQEIDTDVADLDYAAHADSWALLVQGSYGEFNYRHQADVLNMYRLLKDNGWDDDHIVLAISDDLGADSDFGGVVTAELGGRNLYADACIDYDTDTLTPGDIAQIMQGRRSSHLPVVLETDGQSNVLVLWSGHGKPGGFVWRNSDTDLFDADLLQTTLAAMRQDGRYRQMLMFFEPCHSGSMIPAVSGSPGVLAYASSSATEKSFSEFYDSKHHVYLSDRFCNNVIGQMRDNADITLYELYLYAATHTLGSHVTLSDNARFGNLFSVTAAEFVRPKTR